MAITTAVFITPGKMWRTSMRGVEQPATRAKSTYAWFLIVKVWLRITLTNGFHASAAINANSSVVLCPNISTHTSATIRNGSACHMSTSRVMISSTQPPP